MRILAFLAAFLLAAIPAHAGAYWADAVVIACDDGDSGIALINGRRDVFRMLKLDAPELDQPHGKAAARMLQGLLDGQAVRMRIVGRDKYKRLLADVYLSGRLAARAVVAAGLAWAGHSSTRSQHRAAKRARLGLWANPHPIRPAKWRKMSPAQKAAAWQAYDKYKTR